MTVHYLEGDFVEDRRGIIYDVKGFEHPPDGVIAYPRYIPSERGDRARDRRRYMKLYDLAERIAYIDMHLPGYYRYDGVMGRHISVVPRKDIAVHYTPKGALSNLLKRINNLKALEKSALNLAITLSGYSGVPLEHIGISGSLMVGMAKDDSDMDIIVYGDTESRRVADALCRLFDEGILARPDESYMRRLYVHRKAGYTVPYDIFCRIERRKVIQGLYDGREFFIRFLKHPHELHSYGEYSYRALGRVWLEGRVLDDSDSIFTPSIYHINATGIEFLGWSGDIDMGKPLFLSSFRGRYSQHLFRNEAFTAEGTLEEIYKEGSLYAYRLLVGESVKDYVIPKDI